MMMYALLKDERKVHQPGYGGYAQRCRGPPAMVDVKRFDDEPVRASGSGLEVTSRATTPRYAKTIAQRYFGMMRKQEGA